MKKLLLALLLLPAAAQSDEFPIASDGSESYRTSMQSGIDALGRKKYDVAARAFADALRAKAGDKGAEKGFSRAIFYLEIYNTRFGRLKESTIRKFGMEEAVPAIERGLAWLVGEQHANGRWSCKPTDATSDASSTAFALLALMADGNSEATGPHRDSVKRGIAWLLRQQKEDGSFGGPRLYTEGLCVLAMVESFVMGGSELHFQAAQKGINHIVQCQRPEGGWMYSGPETGWGDTSVTGMMFQPLKQGQAAMLDFDLQTLMRGRRFVDKISDAEHWTGYRFGDGRHSVALTAIGNLVRIYGGAGFEDADVKAGLDIVLKHKDQMKHNLYFMYYGVMLAFLAQGEAWTSWRDTMLPHLLAKQVKGGEQAGAWMPEGWDLGSGFANYLSPVDATAMSLLCLECSYRYVPAKMLKE